VSGGTRKASSLQVSACGETHPGHVRNKNEDCFLVDPEVCLYLVLDGMGGHMAGDVASARARDVIRAEVRAHLRRKPPPALLEDAVNAASAAVYSDARRSRDLTGMGTTVVGCLLSDRHAVIAHVGDSRAYLLSGGRLRLLTRDHTVVAELVARGALSPAEAQVHPYKSVLSRNLGGRPDAKVDLTEIDLEAGDRLLLCSDGLSGFASHEAMEQVLAGAEDAERAAAELVELALRGGGGDNVTALVVDCGPRAVAESTQELRQNAASAWWGRRELFRREARARRVHESPICAVLSSDEAIAIVAGNLCEAIYHDLEQAAGLHVWTFAENLASGWLDQGGDYPVLRDLLDRLRESALAVIAEVAAADGRLAVSLETSVLRALIVAEMAVAGAIGERMRRVEDLLVTQHTRETTAPTFADEKTIPFTGAHKVEPPSPVVVACLERARAAGLAALPGGDSAPQAAACIDAAHRAALHDGPLGEHDPMALVRDLFGSRVLNESALRPLFESLDVARGEHLRAVKAQRDEPAIRAAAMRRLASVHQRMMSALALVVAESAQAVADQFRIATVRTARLRAEVGRNEARLSRLERELAGITERRR
jgi:serine/threonine protein phosphatase PrpC